ncbi:piggyBac transposable element-derived protein 4-like [Acyrthosiphon pisum]|uniref:PiggyBac transposable element-derived protein domain-containing protein n=1 Tax=Acyrthosiphon pisum TaxID=7029 RepID=A0A8R2B1T1_ACYPI|nr:piggyBac transposable element-derived protein 4-like [Acyrthosiphon pisum]|eukprot:XP_008179688.1 PREDICTED: piggyBac transposable element-derived protein 4-like [Acyrthosiphon pisum]
MGIKRLPSYRDYWSTGPDLNDPFISKQMTVNRFGWFLSNLHCNDSSLEPKRGSPSFDKLYKLRTVIEKLSECFLKSKNLTQNLTIDESMVKFKGRSTIKQYMPQKPIKRGYKIWMLNDKTKYTSKFQVYTGKVVGGVEKLLGEKIVNDLMLSTFSKSNEKKIYACGTIRSNRKYLPNFLPDKNLKRGDFDYFTSNHNIAVYKWMDNKPVYMISSLHSPNDTFQVKRKLKDGNTTMVPCPKVLIGYNINMNNVDVFDQLKAAYGINRKAKKWWHRLFFHFLDMAIVNAFILFKELTKEKLSMKDFRRRIVDGLLAPNQLQPQKKKKNKSSCRISKHKPHISPEVRFQSSVHQPARGTLRRCGHCSTKKNKKRTEWLKQSLKVEKSEIKNPVLQRARGLELTHPKSKAIMLSRRRAYMPPSFYIGGHPIDLKDSLRYLGVFVGNRLTFAGHIKIAAKKASHSAAALARLMPNARGPC